MYGIIENANLVIDGINNSELIKTKGDDCDMMLRFRAEAKVLRAMIYFDLIRLSEIFRLLPVLRIAIWKCVCRED